MVSENFDILLSPEAEKLLDQNGIDLVLELQRAGLNVRRGRIAHESSINSGTKDVALVLLASGVSATMLSIGIAKVLDAIGRNKKAIVKQVRRAPSRDGGGNIVRDESGNVIYEWTEECKMLEASQTVQDKSVVDADLSSSGLKVEMSSGK